MVLRLLLQPYVALITVHRENVLRQNLTAQSTLTPSEALRPSGKRWNRLVLNTSWLMEPSSKTTRKRYAAHTVYYI